MIDERAAAVITRHFTVRAAVGYMQHPSGAAAAQQPGEEAASAASRFRSHPRLHVSIVSQHHLMALELFPGN